MADKERKEIVIEMKADLKNLLNNLKKMPSMTAQEARKMVNSLEKEFKAANKAAKAAAKQQSKAMKEVKVSAKQAASSVRGLRKQSRELGGSFNAMGDVLTEVNPEMAQFAAGAELAGDSFRSFSRMLATGNPILIGIVTAIVAATAAYAVFTAKAKENKESQERLEKVLTDTTQKIMQQEKAADDAALAMFNHASAANESALEFQLLNGELKEAELQELRLEKKAGDITDKIIERGNAREKSLRKIIGLNETANRALRQRAKDLENQGDAFRQVSKGIGVTIEAEAEYAAIQREIRVNTKQIEEAEEDLKKAQQENTTLAEEAGKRFLEQSKKAQKIRDKNKEDEEARKERLKKEREAEKARNDELRERKKLQDAIKASDEALSSSTLKAEQDALTIAQKNASLRAALQDKKIGQQQLLNENLDIETKKIDAKIQALTEEKNASMELVEIAQQLGDQKKLEEELTSNIILLEEQKALLIKQNAKELAEINKQNILDQLNTASSSLSQVGMIATATGKVIKNLSEDQKQAALVQFRISQGVNIAEIAMDTAKNVVKVFPDPVLTGLAIALGAAQAAAVATQAPPEFHMGGMINKGPDAQVITALKGEAILDRSTVREIGGQRGLRKLKEGGAQGQQVIVRTPFKHFDNYSKVSIKRNGALSRLQKTRSIGAY